MFKNTASQSVTVLAIDTAVGTPKTGDASNITLYYNGDSGGVTVFSTSSGHPSEDDATNAPGCYTLAMTQGETNYNRINITGKSSTSGVRVIPILNIQTVPANFNLASIDSNGRVDVIKIAGTTQTARDIGTSVLLSSGTGTGQLSLSGGLVTLAAVTHTGAVIPTVTTVGTLTTYTGNTPQTGDSFARIGSAGAGLTALGDTRIANLDAAVTTRMATYTQPTGFLAATFPSGTVANTTNITAGTIATATNVTTVNGLAANVITAASIASDVTDEIWTKACTEPTSVVSANPTAIAALSWLLTLSRNKITQTATIQIVKADDTTTTIATSAVSDDGTTFTRNEFS